MKVFLDLDGVLVDFVGGCSKKYGIDRSLVNKWDFYDIFGMTSEDFWKPLVEEFWANLEWHADGQEILNIVEEAFGRDNICLLSSPCRTEGCTEGKLKWIRKHIPKYSRKYLLGPMKQFLAGPNKIMIDDSDDNVKLFRNNGGSAILVARPWNENREAATIDSLKQNIEWIKNYYNLNFVQGV